MLQKQSATTRASSSLLSLVPRSVVIARLSMTASNGTLATKLDKKILLQSIHRYLKANGFSKTVKKLKSEAYLDEDEFRDTLILDLEEICSKHLETRSHVTEAHHKSNPDPKNNGIKEDYCIEKVSKKKKKVKNDDDSGLVEESGLKESHAKSTTEIDLKPEGNTKEKKKSRKSSDSTNQDEKAEGNAVEGETVTDTYNIKKKKHQTLASVTNENAEKNATDAVSEKLERSKRKKKLDSDKDDLPMKTNESKKRKRLSADDGSDKIEDASPDDKSKEAGVEESVATKFDGKFGDANHINEVTKSNNGDKSSGQNSAKKPRNGSAEPTTVKAFQRVKVDEVVIKDERLKDNSYWAKDGAESGYGAKAQEILGQVRGKDFRHEKTKKKRGSYRGGQIDFDSHSIKFNDSDDE